MLWYGKFSSSCQLLLVNSELKIASADPLENMDSGLFFPSPLDPGIVFLMPEICDITVTDGSGHFVLYVSSLGLRCPTALAALQKTSRNQYHARVSRKNPCCGY